MSRAWRALLPAGILAARLVTGQDAAKNVASHATAPAAAPVEEDQLPPDEDAALNAPKQYGFNPVQSRKEVDAGMVYFKKGSYKAAAYRFTEATRWNDGNAEAWLRLGETEEKRGNASAAKVAYERYLEVAPDGKGAAEVKKRVSRLR